MHLLIIILQQLLGRLPNGKGKKAPQVELARSPRPKQRGTNPRVSDPGAFLDIESRRRDWMTHYWSSDPQGIHRASICPVDWANVCRGLGMPTVARVYAQFKRRLRPAPRTGRPPGAADPDVGA
jgi:hypothetical protein